MQSFSAKIDGEKSKNCFNFTVGNPGSFEFFSPNYPNNYPNDTECERVIKGESIFQSFYFLPMLLVVEYQHVSLFYFKIFTMNNSAIKTFLVRVHLIFIVVFIAVRSCINHK